MDESDKKMIRNAIREFLLGDLDDKVARINYLSELIAEESPIKNNPVTSVLWVEVGKIRANDYNPNEVADQEMELLYRSIKHDGYTQPVVTAYDEEEDEYEIVDGFHRYLVLKNYDDIYERSNGRLPITVIYQSIADRMASTIRHNRARGKHNIKGMAQVVFDMLDEGWADERICEELGMEPEELARMKHTTGFSKLFDDTEYQMAWKTTEMIEVEKEFGVNI